MTAALLVLLLMLDTTPRQVQVSAAVTSKPVTACTAVTRADVELALGRKFGRGAEENSNGSSTCGYTAGGGLVTVTMQHMGAAPDLDQEKRSLQAEFPGSTLRAASLSGAEAFFVDLQGQGTLLYAIRGGRDYVMVAILGCGEPAAVSGAAIRLARTALR